MKTFHIKTKYLNDDVFIELGRYHDNSIAIRLLTETGEPASVATVCLSHNKEKPANGNVFIKNWSENEGILKALQEIGIIGESIREITAGFCIVYECQFLIPFDDSRIRLMT